jgi:hypothetical protein
MVFHWFALRLRYHGCEPPIGTVVMGSLSLAFLNVALV